MYTKTINGRQVFSSCSSIQMPNGTWISNPSEEQILEAGWQLYIPPEVTPSPQIEPDYADIINAVKKMLSSDIESLSDEDALDIAALYPTWISNVGQEVIVGKRLWYNGKLWKVIQVHTVQEEWTPNTAVSLYTEVSIEEWPEWAQPTGVQDTYNTGDKVTYNGIHYISKIDNNTWSPADYPAGWEVSE